MVTKTAFELLVLSLRDVKRKLQENEMGPTRSRYHLIVSCLSSAQWEFNADLGGCEGEMKKGAYKELKNNDFRILATILALMIGRGIHECYWVETIACFYRRPVFINGSNCALKRWDGTKMSYIYLPTVFHKENFRGIK